MSWLKRLFGGKSADDAEDTCVACNRKDITVLAPGVYRCNLCRHEGGDGYAAWKKRQADEARAELPVDEVRERVAAALDQLAFDLMAVVEVPELGYRGGGNVVSVSLNVSDAAEHTSLKRERTQQLRGLNEQCEALRSLILLWRSKAAGHPTPQEVLDASRAFHFNGNEAPERVAELHALARSLHEQARYATR